VIGYLALFQCVQCARTAEALGVARISVLWQGVWVLLLPPVAVFGGVLWLAWKRSAQAEVGSAAAVDPDIATGADSRTGARL